MRASLTNTHAGANRRRALLLAALLVAVLSLTTALLDAGKAPAATPQDELRETRDRLEGVRGRSESLAATIAEQNRAIDTMIGEVSSLRREQVAVEQQLGEAEAKLEAATEALEREQAHLEVVRDRLERAFSASETTSPSGMIASSSSTRRVPSKSSVESMRRRHTPKWKAPACVMW